MTPQEREADLYASHLVDGSEILDDTDADVVEPFRAALPAALARRGFGLERLPGKWRVYRPRALVVCDTVRHEALKRDPYLWWIMTTPLQDRWTLGDQVLETRICCACGSSLAREVRR